MTDTQTEHLYAEDFLEYAEKQRNYEDEHYDPYVDDDGNLNLCLSDILSNTANALANLESVNEPTQRILLAEIRCLLDGNVEDADWVFSDSELDAVFADLKVAEGIFDRRIRKWQSL